MKDKKGEHHFLDSIQNKIFLCITLVVSIVVILTTLLIYLNSSSVIKDSALTFMSTTLRTLNRQIQDLHTRTMNILLKIAINETVRTTISLEPELASYEEYEQFREIDTLIRNYMADEGFIERIVIIRSDGRAFFSGNPIMMRDDALSLYNACISHEEGTFFSIEGEIFCYRTIYISQGGMEAIVVADLDEESIDSIFQRSSFTNMDIFVLSDDGQLFAQTPYNSIAADDLGKYMPMLEAGGGVQVMRTDSGRFLGALEYIPDTGLGSVAIVSYHNLFSESYRILYTALLVIILSIGLSVLISYFLSRLITKDLRSLRISMLRISQGDIRERTEIPGAVEIKDLAIIFNNMMDKMDSLIGEAAHREVEKQKLEQDYLSMQIQPHFIYNTLNLVKVMALQHDEEDMAKAITALVDILRAVTGKESRYTTLEHEIGFAKQYVYLHDFRKGCQINLEVEMDGTLADIQVPTLILQPLVENACLHGFEDRQTGRIVIKAFQEEGRTHIQVLDDGVGFETDPDRSGRLYGIGISNVLERMELLYGDAFTFDIASGRNSGTKVELVF